MSPTIPTDNTRKDSSAGSSGGAIPPAVYPQFPHRLPVMGQSTCPLLPGYAHPPGQPCNAYTHPPGSGQYNGPPAPRPDHYPPQPYPYGPNGYPPQHYPPQHGQENHHPNWAAPHPDYRHPQPNPHGPNGYPPQYGQGNYHPNPAGYYYRGPPGDYHRPG